MYLLAHRTLKASPSTPIAKVRAYILIGLIQSEGIPAQTADRQRDHMQYYAREETVFEDAGTMLGADDTVCCLQV